MAEEKKPAGSAPSQDEAKPTPEAQIKAAQAQAAASSPKIEMKAPKDVGSASVNGKTLEVKGGKVVVALEDVVHLIEHGFEVIAKDVEKAL